MTIDEILEAWDKDAELSNTNMDRDSIVTAKLHSKYLAAITKAKLKLKQAEFTMAELKKKKWLWFNGKLSPQEVQDLGWPHDPFNGLKVLKSDMALFFDSDSDIIEHQKIIDYHKTRIELLDEIINTLRWRHNTIRNIIEWRKFESGA